MRKTNEEFAAEVMRRSAEYRRKKAFRLRSIAASAACFVLLAGGFGVWALSRMEKHSTAVSSRDPRDDVSSAVPDGSGPDSTAAHSGISIETEQRAYPAGAKEIPVTVTNQSAEPVSVHPYQFSAMQEGFVYAVDIHLPEEALRRMTVTIQPGASGILLFPASEYLHDLTGSVTLRLLDAETEFYYGN